jgi:hypothetical protein
MQNKPNFAKTKMNPNPCSENDYENKPPFPPPRKQTQSKPNKLEAQRRSLRVSYLEPSNRGLEAHPTLKKLEKGLRDGYNCRNYK